MIVINNLKDKSIHLKKAWGEEVILHNDSDYCGKLLRFNKGARFSMHFHMMKVETFYVNIGEFELTYIDTKTATAHIIKIKEGDIIEIGQGDPHQLYSLTGGEIFEMSTQHFDDDSYRVRKGDSQNV